MNKIRTLRLLGAIMVASLFVVARTHAQPSGQWDFNSSNLTATVGTDMQYADGGGGATSLATTFGSCTAFGIPTISGSNAVVVSRDLGAGHVVMIGTDFATNRTGMDRILANAVRWSPAGQPAEFHLQPGFSDYFENGLWTGELAVQDIGSGFSLRADDGAGHLGLSNPFDVGGANDLSVRISSSPDASWLGGNLVYTITVSNSGLASASNVIVRDKLSLPRLGQFLGYARRSGIERLVLHPAKKCLAGNLIGIRVSLGQLLLNEDLNRLCHRDFHCTILPQSRWPGNCSLANSHLILPDPPLISFHARNRSA